MNWWQALILGLVEGITEYLPVSSTGHLLLAQRLLGIGHSEAADAFAICIQAGAIVAVLALYRQRIGEMAAGWLGKNETGRKLSLNLDRGFPARGRARAAAAEADQEIPLWWRSVRAVAGGAGVAGRGIAILAVNAYRRKRQESDRPRFELDGLTLRMSVIIGVSQCIAMWPGTSRSLVTIVGGILSACACGPRWNSLSCSGCSRWGRRPRTMR